MGSNEAFLALDRNLNGIIDDGGELFGNYTEQPESDDPNGYRALEVFDSPQFGGNRDGWITADDAIYSRLLLWRDENRDGISSPWELTPLSWLGIRSLDLDYVRSNRRDRYGNVLRWTSKVYRIDGSHTFSGDVLLRSQ
jgi:hypothetical protein